jgi:predicted negative regulator of RcsB-dependent stress response
VGVVRAKPTLLYLAGATKRMALAHDKGPYFAGPAKCLGDVLVKRGRPVEALARYEAALKYAPN